jgi:glyoxylase-like metal-dependent hydrolase (beta-lactamase superfamily II)
MIGTDQGSYSTNSLVFFGDDGVLLVDTQSEADRTALKEFVEALELGAPRYIINTHRHVEHIGGNDLFGPDPVIVSHRLFPEKLRRGTFLFSEYPPEAYPDITFADSLEISFNNETVRLVDIAGSHDDNEIMVHFKRHGIAHISSVVNGFNFPSIDKDGDVLQFEPQVRRLMELLPEDVRLISGHNGHASGFDFVGSWNQLRPYAEMMRNTVAIVQQGLSDGMDVESMQAAGVLDEYEHYAGSYVGTDDWIKYVAKALTDPREQRKDICRPVYETWKDRDARSAVDLYRQLATSEPEQYDASEYALLSIGSKLYGRELYGDAAEFLLGSVEQYPDSEYGYYTHYLLANCYQELGRFDSAVEHCRESLRLNPDFEGASSLLSELTGDSSEE